jgi:hypothetical protein
MADELLSYQSEYYGETIDEYLGYAKKVYDILYNEDAAQGQILMLDENKKPTWITLDEAEEVIL